MHSLFGSSGWGREQYGLADDDSVFRLAASVINFEVPEGLTPQAITAVFFARGATANHQDVAYMQHAQRLRYKTAERTLLQKAARDLDAALKSQAEGAGTMEVAFGDNVATDRLAEFSVAMGVPPPPQSRWGAAVVALYIPNALNVVEVSLGAVGTNSPRPYSLVELVTGAIVVFQDLLGGESEHRP
ncbi:hypothetical protein [Mycobacteroides abscessus]